MSFAIEVPGEANPLSLPELCRALEAATGSDNAQRQAAGAQLQAWESHAGFYSSLQTVLLDRTVPHQIRFLAVILLKNGIDKYWRHAGAKNSIKPQERAVIRSRLFQGSIEEEDRSLVLHNALVVAKVFRIDYPQEWPDAFPSLVQAVQTYRSGDQMRLNGALQILLRVVKELGTARLRRSQTALQSVAPETVRLLGEIYAQMTSAWLDYLTHGRGDEDDADLAMQSSLTALKTLRRLLIVGYEYPHHDKLVQEFWALSQNQFGQFLGYVSHDSPIPAPYQDIVGKHLIQFTKLHIEMADSHAPSFCLLPGSIALVVAYWDLVSNFAEVFDKSGGIKQSASDQSGTKTKLEGPLLERLALRGLLLLKECIAIVHRPQQSFKYQSQEAKKEREAAVGLIKTGLLTDEFVLQIVNVIITKLFIFRKSDLEAWDEDPEEWEAKERNEGDAWEWEVRPCAERIFLELLTFYKDLLVQPLLSYFDTTTVAASDTVTKEAVYTAMGCAAAHIYGSFDFDGILTSTLVRDAQIQDPLAKLLRRRIAILLSQWVPVKIAKEHLVLVYEIYRHLMKPDDEVNDPVVRITAARQLKWVADDFSFDGAIFLPFAADIFGYLVSMLQEVNVDETKLAVLETVRVLVARMESQISQFGDAIMSTLPDLWASSGEEEYMIKQSVLSIVSALVVSMKTDSQRYDGFIIPLLAEAMNPESALHLHLIEDSVELWKSLVTQIPPPLSDDLVGLAALALPLLEYDSDVSNQCLQIVKDYILLAPETMLKDAIRRDTLEALGKTLESRSRDQVKLGTASLELLLRAAEAVGGVQGVALLVQDMVEIGLLRRILERLHEAWEASQTTGPNRKISRLNTITETDFFAILARIALADPATFVNMLATLGGSEAAIRPTWEWLSAEWFANFDSMASLDRQKLSCLALTRLSELPQPIQDVTLARLQDYLAMWTTVIAELQDGDAKHGDSLIWDADYAVASEHDTPLDVREREFASKDPVHTVRALDFVRARLEGLAERVGGQQAFEANWAVNVDRDVLAGFQRLFQDRGQQPDGGV